VGVRPCHNHIFTASGSSKCLSARKRANKFGNPVAAGARLAPINEWKRDLKLMGEVFSIASVTVAYNGAEVLARHLKALKGQTRKLDEIIVINNASTDDTTNLLVNEYPEATLLNLPQNGGVGGGYAAGLNYAALTKKYDWVWLFDQDSVPALDSLELLLAALQQPDSPAADAAILAPVVVNKERGLVYPLVVWRNGLRMLSADPGKDEISFVDSVISSGTLIRREAVEKAGLPRADFFMDFVDHEYCLRLRRLDFKIAVVASSRLDHTLGDPREVSLLGLAKVWTGHAPWREYYMTRNEIFTVWNYYPDWRTKCYTVRRLLHGALHVLLFGERKLYSLMLMYRGFLDGRAGRLGVRSFPGEKRSVDRREDYSEPDLRNRKFQVKRDGYAKK
jgi:GT2 family glycosyltransferase